MLTVTTLMSIVYGIVRVYRDQFCSLRISIANA